MNTIYKITNRKSKKVYIGRTKRDIDVRWGQHVKELKMGIHPNEFLLADFNALGLKAFKFEVICTTEDVAEAKRLENHWMKQFKEVYNACGPVKNEANRLYEERRTASFRKTVFEPTFNKNLRAAIKKARNNPSTVKLQSDATKRAGAKRFYEKHGHLIPKYIEAIKYGAPVSFKDTADIFGINSRLLADFIRTPNHHYLTLNGA